MRPSPRLPGALEPPPRPPGGGLANALGGIAAVGMAYEAVQACQQQLAALQSQIHQTPTLDMINAADNARNHVQDQLSNPNLSAACRVALQDLLAELNDLIQQMVGLLSQIRALQLQLANSSCGAAAYGGINVPLAQAPATLLQLDAQFALLEAAFGQLLLDINAAETACQAGQTPNLWPGRRGCPPGQRLVRSGPGTAWRCATPVGGPVNPHQ